jgi:serine/threonine-protein kinase
MTAEIGRVLGGRYRLVAPIGMGASAQVYLADDVKLRRRVALKMLHDALAGDAEFLRRFRAEARAAAALSHPNVMAVYDWSDGSDEGEAAFIVTEYLPGGSLRALLDGGSLLTPAQALGVGLEAARALDYAHRRGFVHRDIKPANLLFGEEQRLRIADFGLARALAEAAWTEPQGAVLGTARYASPEQAKGERLTGEADVYALALVLIEAVTGEVPFVADTTLGTLMARVDRELVVPDALGPLQSVLVGAGHPDPAQRIDARTLAKGLLRAAKKLARPAPLPLVGALAAGAALSADADPTVHTVEPADAAPTDLTADDLELDPPAWVNQAEPVEPAAPVVAGAALAASIAAGGAVAEAPIGEAAGADELGGADVDADVAAEAAEAPGDDDIEGEAEPAPEGEPEGEPDGDAPEEHDEPGEPDEEPVADAGDADGAPELSAVDETVVGPRPGVVASASDEPSTDQVAAVAGSAGSGGAEAPADALVGAPDEGGRRRRRWPWAVLVVLVLGGAIGAVAAVIANQDEAPAAPAIDLPVPTFAGRTEAEAQAMATAGGWKVQVVRERRDGSVRGEVLESSPAPGTRHPAGRTITLTVSEGQTIVDVPTDLADRPLDEATQVLADVGLEAEVVEEPFSEDVEEGRVIGVAEGTPGQLEKGATVGLVVSAGPEPRIVPSGLVGSTEDAAVEALEALGLNAAIVRSFSDSVAEGQVISVLPATGATVERGATINVEVSRGPELIAVPDISGADSISEAIALIEGAGLDAGSVSGPAAGSPQGTSPGAGSLVRPGSTIDIVLG